MYARKGRRRTKYMYVSVVGGERCVHVCDETEENDHDSPKHGSKTVLRLTIMDIGQLRYMLSVVEVDIEVN